MFKFENGAIVALSEEEEAAVMAAYEDYIRQQEKKPMTQSEVLDLLTKELVNTVSIPDKTSLRMKSYYPTFDEIAAKESEEDRTVKAGFKVYHEGDLWKTRQNTVIQKQYPPSIDTASIWERIDEEHTGTVDDPIPYDQTMAVYYGKYYTYDGILYLCIRDSGNPLYADPGTLIDNYFVVADETGETQPGQSGEGEESETPTEPDGSKEHPYTYDQAKPVNNGYYYIHDGQLYLCIRDSGNALYASPGDLIGNFFQLAE